MADIHGSKQNDGINRERVKYTPTWDDGLRVLRLPGIFLFDYCVR